MDIIINKLNNINLPKKPKIRSKLFAKYVKEYNKKKSNIISLLNKITKYKTPNDDQIDKLYKILQKFDFLRQYHQNYNIILYLVKHTKKPKSKQVDIIIKHLNRPALTYRIDQTNTDNILKILCTKYTLNIKQIIKIVKYKYINWFLYLHTKLNIDDFNEIIKYDKRYITILCQRYKLTPNNDSLKNISFENYIYIDELLSNSLEINLDTLNIYLNFHYYREDKLIYHECLDKILSNIKPNKDYIDCIKYHELDAYTINKLYKYALKNKENHNSHTLEAVIMSFFISFEHPKMFDELINIIPNEKTCQNICLIGKYDIYEIYKKYIIDVDNIIIYAIKGNDVQIVSDLLNNKVNIDDSCYKYVRYKEMLEIIKNYVDIDNKACFYLLYNGLLDYMIDLDIKIYPESALLVKKIGHCNYMNKLSRRAYLKKIDKYIDHNRLTKINKFIRHGYSGYFDQYCFDFLYRKNGTTNEWIMKGYKPGIFAGKKYVIDCNMDISCYL